MSVTRKELLNRLRAKSDTEVRELLVDWLMADEERCAQFLAQNPLRPDDPADPGWASEIRYALQTFESELNDNLDEDTMEELAQEEFGGDFFDEDEAIETAVLQPIANFENRVVDLASRGYPLVALELSFMGRDKLVTLLDDQFGYDDGEELFESASVWLGIFNAVEDEAKHVELFKRLAQQGIENSTVAGALSLLVRYPAEKDILLPELDAAIAGLKLDLDNVGTQLPREVFLRVEAMRNVGVPHDDICSYLLDTFGRCSFVLAWIIVHDIAAMSSNEDKEKLKAMCRELLSHKDVEDSWRSQFEHALESLSHG